MPVADFEQYVQAPLTPSEIGEAQALITWFRRRYPTLAERLTYARHAWAAAQKLAELPLPAAPEPSGSSERRLLPTFAASPEDLALDLAAIDWFLWHRGGRGEPVDDRPIGRWLRNFARYARAADTSPETVFELEAPARLDQPGRDLSALADVYGARLLGWSVRALENYGRVSVDASFVRDEVCNRSTRSEDASLRMPGGVGTLYLAARCVAAAGGAVHVRGGTPPKSGSKKIDLDWWPEGGGHIGFEQKDRAFFRSVDAEGTGLGRWLARQVTSKRTSDQIEVAPPGSLRAASVGAVTRAAQVDPTLNAFRDEIEASKPHLRALPPGRRPDVVVAVIFGYGTRGGLVDARFEPKCIPISDEGEGPAWDALRAAFTSAV